MAKDSKASVLVDHERHKKKLVPPLIAAMGGSFSPYSWARELAPEYLWIALLMDGLGDHEGTALCNLLGTTAAEVCSAEPKPLFAPITSFLELSDDEKDAVVAALGRDACRKISDALEPLTSLIGEHPLSFLVTVETSSKQPSKDLGEVLQDLYDRQSRRSVMTMATAYYLGLNQDKIRLSAHLVDKVMRDFSEIENYPDTDESRAAAASFRASAPMVLMKYEEEESGRKHQDWLERFWACISRHGECISPKLFEEEREPPEDPYGKFVAEFRAACKRELEARIAAWGFELKRIEVYEVVGALLARQVALTIEFALVPNAWTPNSAPLFLRAMADVHIIVAWILGEPDSRAQKFIDAGLSEAKLELAHRRKNLEELSDQDQIAQQNEYIEHLELWLQSQRIEMLVEVNLGSWSGISTRKMAEEAGCLDFYSLVYQPFSTVAHSSWLHVSRANTAYCTNPSHRFHRLPAIKEADPSIRWLYLAAKYLQKTFAKFDDMTGVKSSEKSAFKLLCEWLDGEDSELES